MKWLWLIVMSTMLLSVQTGRSDPLQDESKDLPFLVTQLGHSGGVGSVSFSTDGLVLLTVSTDDSAVLWDTKTGRELRRFVARPFGYHIHSGELSPNKKLVVTVDGKKARV